MGYTFNMIKNYTAKIYIVPQGVRRIQKMMTDDNLSIDNDEDNVDVEGDENYATMHGRYFIK